MGIAVDVIAGARPNFMKVAALFAVMEQFPDLQLRLIHTGQHYDMQMSEVFLQDLALPEPACHLGVGSGSHAVQTAKIMQSYEEWVLANPPAWCVVVGDVNSTLACALTAVKLGIQVAHVEAGLRSFDRKMPEEINRLVTDSISDLLFVTEVSGVINLSREGQPSHKIHLVGHVMVDTLFRMKPKAELLHFYQQVNLAANTYAYLTLHRPSNVDDPATFGLVIEQILWMANRLPVVFPVHPRTQQRLEESGLISRLQHDNLKLINPIGYLESLSLLLGARVVVTDSGGLQEESTALGIPCFTLRDTTERPITVEQGSNILISNDWELFRRSLEDILTGSAKQGDNTIPYWDGKAGERILEILNRESITR